MSTVAPMTKLAMTPLSRVSVLAEIATEREHQIEKFGPGNEDLPDGTGAGGYITYRNIAQNSCDRAMREKRLTHAHVFEEEYCEVLAETDPAKLRAELIQAAAVAVKWIEAIDRRSR